MRLAAALLLATGLATGAAARQPHTLTVANRSGVTILELHVVTPSGGFGELRDWLGDAVLPHGGTVVLRGLPAGLCRWDVAVMFQDQRRREWRNLNICAAPRLVVPACTARHCRPRD